MSGVCKCLTKLMTVNDNNKAKLLGELYPVHFEALSKVGLSNANNNSTIPTLSECASTIVDPNDESVRAAKQAKEKKKCKAIYFIRLASRTSGKSQHTWLSKAQIALEHIIKGQIPYTTRWLRTQKPDGSLTSSDKDIRPGKMYETATHSAEAVFGCDSQN